MINFQKSTTQIKNFKPLVKLLGSGDGIEITQYEVGKNSALFIKPSIEISTYEFYYIVKGKIEYKSTIYSQNDYFDVEYINKDFALKALEDTIILFISSNIGEFENASNFNNVLLKQLESIQKKDHYTFEHCLRVKRLVISIAKVLKLNDTELKNLAFAAYFHDVGKIKIDDKILNKLGFYTEDEYSQMKKHVTYSYDIISEAITSEVADILLLHHEKLDGSGYPKGLKGDEISYLGRILAVVDTFDAMTTDRVYKKGKDTDTAIKELYSLSHQYDINIIRVLEKVINNQSHN